MTEEKLAPERALRHPLWWGSLVVLVLNDHALKGSGWLPGSVTGKLSDIAGLVVAPVLLAAVCQARSRRGVAGALGLVAAWFVAVKTIPAATALWTAAMAAVALPWTLVCDPTDLVALPMLAVAWYLATRPATSVEPARLARWAQLRAQADKLLAAAGAVACMATSSNPGAMVRAQPGALLAPAGGGGVVFVIDPSTGRRVGAPGIDDAVLDVVELDGRIFVASSRAIRGFDVDDGRETFTYEHEEGGTFHRRILTDGKRLFLTTTRSSSSDTEEVVAIDIARKKLLWRKPLPSEGGWRGPGKLAIYGSGLIIATAGHDLVTYDPGTGQRRWEHHAKSNLAWPVAQGRLVYAVDEEGTIVAIDVESGVPAWRHRVGSPDGFDPDHARGPRLGAGKGSLAFIRGEKLVAIDAATRSPRWQGPVVVDAVIGSSVAVGRLEEDEDICVVLDMASGKELWRLEDAPYGPVVADDDGLVLFRDGGDLLAYDMGNGKARWRFDFEAGDRADYLTSQAWVLRGL